MCLSNSRREISPQTPVGEFTALPQTPAGFNGPLRGGRGMEGRRAKDYGEGEGEGRERGNGEWSGKRESWGIAPLFLGDRRPWIYLISSRSANCFFGHTFCRFA